MIEQAGAELHRVQGVVFALVRAGHILMERCPKKAARHGAQWFVPGGRVEDRETPTEAFFREIREELRVEPNHYTAGPLVDATGGDNYESFLMRIFLVTSWFGEVPEQNMDRPEVPLKWIPTAEAERSSHGAVRAILAHVETMA